LYDTPTADWVTDVSVSENTYPNVNRVESAEECVDSVYLGLLHVRSDPGVVRVDLKTSLDKLFVEVACMWRLFGARYPGHDEP